MKLVKQTRVSYVEYAHSFFIEDYKQFTTLFFFPVIAIYIYLSHLHTYSYMFVFGDTNSYTYGTSFNE